MSRRVLAFGLLALLLTAVESALMAAFGLGGVGMYLAMGVLLLAAVRAADIEGAAIAALVGYGWDIFSGAPTGMSIAPAVAIFVGVRMLSQGVEVGGALQIAVLGFVCAFLHGLGCLGLSAFAGGLGELAVWSYLYALLGHSTLSGLVAAPVFFLARALDRFLVDERSESEVWLS